jgi:hypothetical protein
MWSIRGAIQENRDGVPGVGLFRHGYVVFASTTCGDAYCVNTNVPTSCLATNFAF